MSIKHVYPIAVVAILACSSANSLDKPRMSMPGRQSDLITNVEMVAAHADVNTAYDAVARLRPNWLAAHGITSGMNNGAGTEYALVFVDGLQYGDLNSLRGIPAYHVGSIRYYDVTQAGGRFGIRAGSSGVIEVTMLSPTPR